RPAGLPARPGTPGTGRAEPAVVVATRSRIAHEFPRVADQPELGDVPTVVRVGAAGGAAPGGLELCGVRVEGHLEDLVGGATAEIGRAHGVGSPSTTGASWGR